MRTENQSRESLEIDYAQTVRTGSNFGQYQILPLRDSASTKSRTRKRKSYTTRT